ncbi:hypothetical protein C9439_03415 [archaeon SCG-AAA382B04]|nr:hypothetical protein C9439_03415 [archaeon SCG-AAA382B04]
MMNELKQKEEGLYHLEAIGYSCPYPELLARQALEEINEGEVLHIETDNKPSVEEVPEMATEKGHQVIEVEQIEKGRWLIKIKKK